MSAPICRPVIVITGISVFFSAWRKWIARSFRPRARAKRMYSVRSTSSISERTSRMNQRHLEEAERDRGRMSDRQPSTVRKLSASRRH